MGEKSMSGRVGTQKSRCGDANSEVQETGNVAGARARAKELNYYGEEAATRWGLLLSGSCHPKGDSLGGMADSLAVLCVLCVLCAAGVHQSSCPRTPRTPLAALAPGSEQESSSYTHGG
jgi:hypothetical protein